MAARKRSNRRRKRAPDGSRWVIRALYVLLGLFAVGELSEWIWLGLLSEQFRVYLVPPMWALAPFAVRQRHWPAVGLVVLASGLWLGGAWPLWQPVSGTPSRGPSLVVLTQALGGARPEPEDFARFLRAAEADVVALTGAPWKAEQRIHGGGDYRAFSVRPAAKGATTITLLTRLPVLHRPARDPSGAVRSELRAGACPVHVTVVSAPAVWRAALAADRQQLFETLETATEHDARVWLGDFGGDVRAPGPRALMRRGRLTDSRLGHGRNATWPPALGPVGIAMDHILVGGWIAVRERSTGPRLEGAGRRAARARLQLTAPSCVQ